MGRKTAHMINDFYCIKCGKKSFPLPRRKSYQHERFHRKKMWCYHCKEEVNHIECKTYEDVEKFKEDFENGVFVDELEESLAFVRASRERKNNLGIESN